MVVEFFDVDHTPVAGHILGPIDIGRKDGFRRWSLGEFGSIKNIIAADASRWLNQPISPFALLSERPALLITQSDLFCLTVRCWPLHLASVTSLL